MRKKKETEVLTMGNLVVDTNGMLRVDTPKFVKTEITGLTEMYSQVMLVG